MRRVGNQTAATGVNRLQSDAVTYAPPQTATNSSARIQLDLIGGINNFMPSMTAHAKKADLQDEQIKMLTRCHTIAEINSIRNKFSKYNNRDFQQNPQQGGVSPRKKGFPPIVSNSGPYSTNTRFNEYSMTPRLTRQREKLREIQEEMRNIKHIPNAGSKMPLRRLEGYELRGSKISNYDKPAETHQHMSSAAALPGEKPGSYFPTPTAMRKAIETYKDKKQMKYSEERHVRHLDREGKSTAITAYIKKQINQKRMLHQGQGHSDDPQTSLTAKLAAGKKQSTTTKLTGDDKSGANLNGVSTYVVRDHSDKVMTLPGTTTFNLTTKNLEIYDFITNPRHDEDEDDDDGYVDERVIAWVMDRQVDPSSMTYIPEETEPGRLLPALTEPEIIDSQADRNTFTDYVADNGELDVHTMYSPSRATTTT